MVLHVVPCSTDKKRRWLRRLVPVVASGGLLLSGCGGGDEQPAQPAATAAPSQSGGQSGNFPNLGDVPSQAPVSTPRIERDKLVQGLMADKSHAEYTDQSLGEETSNVPAAAPPPPEPKSADQAQGAAPAAGASGTEATAPAAEAPPPAPAPVKIAELPANLGTATALIYFGAGSADLTDHDRAVLHDVAEAYAKERSSRVRVVGHASATEAAGAGAAGGSASDTALARADAVAKALIKLGVPARALETSTGGAAYDETQPNGVAANRRVEVYIGS